MPDWSLGYYKVQFTSVFNVSPYHSSYNCKTGIKHLSLIITMHKCYKKFCVN